MTAGQQDQPEFKQLWPTLMLRHRLPGADRANPILLELVTGMERERPDLTTEYLEGNLFDHKHPVLDWLRSCMNRAVLDYARAADILLWPAFLHHLVHPNLSDELRVSISFNVVLRWHASYLP